MKLIILITLALLLSGCTYAEWKECNEDRVQYKQIIEAL